MAPVELPPEFVPSASCLKTDDVNIVPAEARLPFRYVYDKCSKVCSAICQTVSDFVARGDRSPMGGA